MILTKKLILIVTILIVTMVALGLRLKAVDELPIDYDEDDYLFAAQHYAESIRQRDIDSLIEYEFNFEHPPLTKILYGLSIMPLPISEGITKPGINDPIASWLPASEFYIMRLVSVALGTWQVLAMALIDPLAALFLAINTWQIKYTSQIMLEPLPALMSLLTVMLYRRSQRRWNRWLFLSAMAFGITLASKYPYGIVGLAIILDILVSNSPINPKDIKGSISRSLFPIIGWGVLSIIFFLIFNPRMWSDPFIRILETVAYHAEYSQSDRVSQVGFPFWQPFVWLFSSVPWHPGVFIVAIDALVAFLALVGLSRLWGEFRVFALWLILAIGFLLIWPTKWPQYILILTAPLSLSAAVGFRTFVWSPIKDQLRRRRAASRQGIPQRLAAGSWRELLRALPWLLPGVIILAGIAFYPMIFQFAMSLTDFSSTAIRDGLSGGIWRETWLGITGQVQPVVINLFERSSSKLVRYAGFGLLRQLFGGAAVELLVFGILWTFLSVSFQTALGIGVALLLNRRGVLFRGWWRVIYILPWAVPEFVGALIWSQIFDPRFGWMNQLASTWYERADYPGAINIVAQWQENTQIALLVLLITATWYGFPLMMLAASAGLKLISVEVYDAAAIDGAGPWQKFSSITWPLLLPLLAPAIIIRAIFAFNQFYIFYVLNPPYPLMTLATASFFFLDEGGNFAASAAINILTVLVLVVIVLIFNRWSKTSEGVSYA